MTAKTYAQYERYLTVYKKRLYYGSFPVIKADAKKDILIEPDGTKKPLCF